ncbi:hypothetical protein CHELA1G11_20222 [Hyphomicrobiales bacterium]|nr:hypothetical protein CHELA1G11_20222 [Hyphomicrobiales bacterium]
MPPPPPRHRCGGSCRNPNPSRKTGADACGRAGQPSCCTAADIGSPSPEQLTKHGVDLPSMPDLAHHEMPLRYRDCLIGPPEITRARSRAGWHRVLLAANLKIGEILAGRKDLVVQQAGGLGAVAAHVVAIRGLSDIDVPVSGVVALTHDDQHLFQGRRDDRAAGLGRIEEGLLVHLFRPIGMTDEDDVDVIVAAREEEMQQREEALCQILHMFAHGPGDIHQTEHDGLGDRFRIGLVPTVTQIDGVDIGNPAIAPHKAFPLLPQGDKFAFRGALTFKALNLTVKLEYIVGARPAQRQPARQRQSHGSRYGKTCRGTGRRVARSLDLLGLGVHETPLGEIRQFEIVEKEIEVFLFRQDETELVLPIPSLTGLGTRSTASAARTRDGIALDIFLVSREDMVPLAAARGAPQGGLMHTLPRNSYLAALIQVLDTAAFEIIAHGTLHQRFRASQKALAIGKALATGIEASINDVHR